MQVQILGISQGLSFVDGTSSNSVILQLPGGKTIRASISDEDLELLTATFVQSGGPAVQRAISASAAPSPAPLPSPRITEEQFSPMTFADGEETVPEFGGDLSPNLAAVGENLRAAESLVARATEGLSDAEVHEAAQRLRAGIAEINNDLPTPGFQGRVVADDGGNPVIVGGGHVDHYALGSAPSQDGEEEDVSQV